jgi:hypothetical protein
MDRKGTDSGRAATLGRRRQCTQTQQGTGQKAALTSWRGAGIGRKRKHNEATLFTLATTAKKREAAAKRWQEEEKNTHKYRKRREEQQYSSGEMREGMQRREERRRKRRRERSSSAANDADARAMRVKKRMT